MKVRELVAELQGLDPEAEVRFFHLRNVKEDGTGRVDSFRVVEVSKGDDGGVALSDFQAEDGCLYRVRSLEWPEQPALKSYQLEEEAVDEPLPAQPSAEAPTGTLLVDPPFSKEEWRQVRVEDVGEEGTPLGKRVLAYIRLYHEAVLRSGRAGELLDEAGLATDPQRPLSAALLRRFLRGLLERDDNTVRRLETLMAVSSFVHFLGDNQSLRLGPKTLQLVEHLDATTVLIFTVCVNQHFGLLR
jgi:hypothetical protein